MKTRRYHALALSSPMLFVMLVGNCNEPMPVVPPTPGPIVSAVSPVVGPTAGGIEISITGQNFLGGASVTIAEAAATQVKVVSPTRITAMLPAKPGAFGKVLVVIQNSDGQAASSSALFGYYVSQLAFPGRVLPVGTQPYSVALGDFNGDQTPDLAVANRGSNDISVLLGNSQGSFGAAINFTVGMTPVSMAVGDFNGDKKTDLIVANSGTNNVSVLLGNGLGSFGAATNFDVGTSPYAVAVGDVNGDNKLDLIVANNGNDTVSALLGDGQGSFGAATNFNG